ncbi:hypothetical protein MICAC_5520016 [Microcystis aeruginosa PCC 9443]|uniref:Uncharacterized protein n=1 Tax=Microcystis aeruginosa PCC 9443 TaxID=1160281 RepID=I4G8L7_MICAE|nr:hypothetical protein MICAC_5520016 [Microcystis aeruginosa PCC 9443]
MWGVTPPNPPDIGGAGGVWGVGELSGFDYPGRGTVFPIIEFFLHFFNNLLHL